MENKTENATECTGKKSVKAVDLVIIVAIVALVIGLVFAFVSLQNASAAANANNQQLLDQLNKLEEQLNGKQDSEDALSWETVLAELESRLDKIQFPEGVTKEEITAAINEAIKNYKDQDLTADAVVKMIEAAIAKIQIPEGVTKEEIADIINEAINGYKKDDITAEQIQAMIKDAIAGIKHPESGLTAEQVEAIIKDALAKYECDCLTKEEIEELIKDILANQGGVVEEETIVEVSDVDGFLSALEKPSVEAIILQENITLTETLVIDRDLVLDLNGHTIKAAKEIAYPNARILAVNDECVVTVKNGSLVDMANNIRGGMDYIRIGKNAVLNLENVDVNISITNYIYFNNTMDRWQSDSANHRIIVIGNGATANLLDSDVSVVSPKTQNFSNYVRVGFSIVGVHFAKDSSNAKLVMDNGSFNIKVTDPNAAITTTDYTDTLYFVKSERDTANVAKATNTVSLKGKPQITIGTVNTAGKLNTTNGLFQFGMGYTNGKMIGSGLKNISLSAGTTFNVNGYAYSVKAGASWDTEAKYQGFGIGNSQLAAYEVTEIKYHVVCSDKAFGCNHEADMTLAEIAAYTKEWGTIKVDGVYLPNCSHCKYGGLQVIAD